MACCCFVLGLSEGNTALTFNLRKSPSWCGEFFPLYSLCMLQC
ncbi:rCG26887 [Rattus norvegicus]|uniref:RCG26887 n=1 Tax=Rattus norvegicus TaxID=10116 RepID=A6HM94_RAT|nr:rCG26887 [Rattus norvegicus]